MDTNKTIGEAHTYSSELLENYFDNAQYENEDDYLKPAGSRYADHADDHGHNASGFHLMMGSDFEDDDRN